ncbi:MAG TPA: CsbD family protein [Thermoanaerobaculia bacterium]
MRVNRDEVKGKIDEASGTVKQNVGRAMGDQVLEEKGADQRASGKLEAGFGKARRKVGEAMKEAGDKLGK